MFGEGYVNCFSQFSSFPVECPQDGFTLPTTAAAPVHARRVNPSWCFSEFSNGLFTKHLTANYASYNFLILLKELYFKWKAWSPEYFFDFTLVFFS